MSTTYNRKQLATWEEARECARLLSAGHLVVGDGVKPETRDPKTSGIYVPAWDNPNGMFPAPSDTDEKTGKEYHWLHFRFNNGAEGMNVGLILDQFRRYPNSPSYVLRRMQDEANMLASGVA